MPLNQRTQRISSPSFQTASREDLAVMEKHPQTQLLVTNIEMLWRLQIENECFNLSSFGFLSAAN